MGFHIWTLFSNYKLHFSIKGLDICNNVLCRVINFDVWISHSTFVAMQTFLYIYFFEKLNFKESCEANFCTSCTFCIDNTIILKSSCLRILYFVQMLRTVIYKLLVLCLFLTNILCGRAVGSSRCLLRNVPFYT